MEVDTEKENPFTPTFGEIPAHMAGRTSLLSDLHRAFSASRRSPYLTTAVTGARGTGKTALLASAANDAESIGWIAVRAVALPGMLDDILITAQRMTGHLTGNAQTPRLTGIEIGQAIGAQWERPTEATNWRNDMTILLEQLEETQTGLLIVVDEVQPNLQEMIQLAAVYQLFVTEGRKVALFMAGLPHNILQLEKDKTVSFLRRAQQCQLGRIPDFEVADAMRKTIEESGRDITDEALDVAVNATGGFAFMMQLVGFRMWDRRPGRDTIEIGDAQEGAALAQAEFEDRIVRVTYESLSKGDKAFLNAMLQDKEASRVSDIAHRMGKSTSYATQYKNRLLGQGVIAQCPDGRVCFDLPLLREYAQTR